MLYLFSAGGAIVWLILLAGILGLVVFLERAYCLHRARIKTEDFLRGVFNILRKNNIQEAVAICEETPGPTSYIVKTAILHRGESREIIREEIEKAGTVEISRMERRLVVVATVAQIAPLLGLLGTVIGMVESLLFLQQQAALVHSADIMKGMMHALAATAAGLFVTIPAQVGFNMLVIKIDRIVLDMEQAGSEMTSFLCGGGSEIEEKMADVERKTL
jgi:biopolymer transport protein ExbB